MSERTSSRKSRILISIGMLIMSGTILLRQFFETPDFVRGGLMGVAIGIMLTGLILQHKQAKLTK